MTPLAKTLGKLATTSLTYNETQGRSFRETLSCGKQSIKLFVFFYLFSTSTLPCHNRPISCGEITITENVVGEVGYYFELCLLGMAKFNALRHGGRHILVSVNITEPQMRWTIGFPGLRADWGHLPAPSVSSSSRASLGLRRCPLWFSQYDSDRCWASTNP